MSAGAVEVDADVINLLRTYRRAARTIAEAYPRDGYARGAEAAMELALTVLGIDETTDDSQTASEALSATADG